MAHAQRTWLSSHAQLLPKPSSDPSTAPSPNPVRSRALNRSVWTLTSFGAPRVVSRISAGLRDVFSKLTGQSEGASELERDSAMAFEDNAPSWEELEAMVARRKEELGVRDEDPENGPPSPLALKRNFGTSGTPRVKLYRDHAGWCPYCQKVWMQLEEKRIPYTLEKINMRCYGDKPDSFLRLSPSGLLPVMEIDGKVLNESAVIAKALETEFPDTPLLPQDPSDRQKVDPLLRLERKIFGTWCQYLTTTWSQQTLRRQFEMSLDEVDQKLTESGGPYFLGKQFSLVDITFAPFLERMAASLAYYKGLKMRGTGQWSALERWFDEMETRPTYIATRSDYYTHAHALPPQLGGCGMVKDGESTSAAIDGRDQKSWRLPLPLIEPTSLEPYAPGEDPPRDRLEAAARLVGNHSDVVKFGLRAVGKPGEKPVWAPLADPGAVPGVDFTNVVDAGFRHVAHALLVGVEEKQTSDRALKVKPGGDGLDGLAPVYCAEYVRDRVGVPRDLKFPAARQLRAHFNWLIDTLRG